MDWKLSALDTPLIGMVIKNANDNIESMKPWIIYAAIFFGGTSGGGYVGSQMTDGETMAAIKVLQSQMDAIRESQLESKRAVLSAATENLSLYKQATENRIQIEELQRRLTKLEGSPR